MKRDFHVLMLEDMPGDAELIECTLRSGGLMFTAKRVDRREDFVAALEGTPPDLILSDYTLPGFNGFQALTIAQEKCPHVPFVFVTGTLGEEVAIDSMKHGATDYVLKTRLSALVPAVRRALREAQERAERKRAEEELRESNRRLQALSVYLQSVREEERTRMQAFSVYLQSVREEERTRIAREVHDELGQALTGLKINLVHLSHQLPPRLRGARESIRSLASNVDEIIQTVRRIASELRPGVLDALGLQAAIEWQANDFQSRTGIECHVVANVEEIPLSRDLNTVCFRIFQELIANIARHAEATHVEVRLKEHNGVLELEVSDNGRGITEQQVYSDTSLGLIGMRERAALVGGELYIHGTAGQGTVATVRIPLSRRMELSQPHHEDSDRR